jgi:hypothetical protein
MHARILLVRSIVKCFRLASSNPPGWNRIRALRVYPRHTQHNAIAFLDHVIATCPFRIHTVRTDRGHEFQAPFHWHLADEGIQHVYIKPRTPRLNGKVAEIVTASLESCRARHTCGNAISGKITPPLVRAPQSLARRTGSSSLAQPGARTPCRRRDVP